MLPKLEFPIHNCVVPSTGQKIQLRPIKVVDEKLLLIAKEAATVADIYSAVNQVVNNCIVGGTVDSNKLTLFDIDYLFLKLRSISINNIVSITYTDPSDDNKQHNFDIDLEKVEVPLQPADKVIKINATTALTLRYPTGSLYQKIVDQLNSDVKISNQLISSCLESIAVGDSVEKFDNYDSQAIDEFVNNLDVATYQKIQNFVDAMPSLYYKIDYKDSKGQSKQLELKSLTDFFTF